MKQVAIESDDAQKIAEVALALRNLSYTLSGFVSGETPLDGGSLTDALFSLHRQVENLGDRLDEIGDRCKTCIAGEDKFVPEGCPAVYTNRAEDLAALNASGCSACSLIEMVESSADYSHSVK